MNTYFISEAQNLNDTREGEKFTGTLNEAMKYAHENQLFFGTIMRIKDENGECVKDKKDGGRWKTPCGENFA